MSNVKQVIVMRHDLGMRRGKCVSQGAHASMKVFLDRIESVTDVPNSPNYEMRIHSITEDMREWIHGSFTKICVRVNSEDELLAIYNDAREHDLPVALIQDNGKTEFKQPTLTCLAIGPVDSEKVDGITGHLKLL